MTSVEVRTVELAEHRLAGDLVVRAYRALPGARLSEDHAALLADVARRAEEVDVLVAWTAVARRVVGCVTFVTGPTSPWAELLDDREAGIRMLAVDPAAQGRGVGRALVAACIEHARRCGCRAVMLHTTPWMTAAQHLYEQLGFTRLPERDWTPEPGVPLRAYRLVLAGTSGR